MITKTVLPFSLALICLLFFSGVVLAANELPQGNSQAEYGVVVALGTGSITVQNPQGAENIFIVDENTQYRAAHLDEPGIDDLQEGSKVAVFSRTANGDAGIARLIVVLPDDFEPGQWASIRARGEITHVDGGVNSFVVQTQSGEEMVFFTDDQTRYYGQVSGYDDLVVGLNVAVGGTEDGDGGLIAKLIGAADSDNTSRRVGTIGEVLPAAGTFTLITRQNEELVIAVDENTRYRSRDDQIQELVDLAPDMVAVVVGVLQEDGVIMSSQVAVANKEDLPNFDVRSGGTIISIVENSLTIQNRSGEEITFLIDDETNVRGLGASSNLEDLEVGMIALVGGYESDDGPPMAKLIIVRENKE